MRLASFSIHGFIESFKGAFRASTGEGARAGVTVLQPGMDAVPIAFISPDREGGELPPRREMETAPAGAMSSA